MNLITKYKMEELNFTFTNEYLTSRALYFIENAHAWEKHTCGKIAWWGKHMMEKVYGGRSTWCENQNSDRVSFNFMHLDSEHVKYSEEWYTNTTCTSIAIGSLILFISWIFLKMSTISDLPDEMISIILSNDSINIQDIVNISITCKRLYNTVEQISNIFWQRKFYQRWPRLKRICEKEIRQKHIDFKELVKTRIESRKRLLDYLAQMNKQWFFISEYIEKQDQQYEKYKYSNFTKHLLFKSIDSMVYVHINKEDIDFLIDQKEETRSLNCYSLVDELTSLFKESKSGHKFDELTNILYGKLLLPYLKHYQLRNIWQKFINRPVGQQLLEEAAAFVLQWYRPEEDISYSHMETELDNYAYQTIKFLRIENPKHPILLVSHEQLSFWKYNNIDENQWIEQDTRQILNILCKVLETKGYYTVSQAIIFHGVARRLGIRCDITSNDSIRNPFELLLIWKPKYNTTYYLNNEQCFHIKAFHIGSDPYKPCQPSRQITIEPMNNFNTYYKLNSVEVATKLIKHANFLLIVTRKSWFANEYMQRRWLYESYVLVQPYIIQEIKKFVSFYYYYKMDLSPIITALEKIIDDDIGFEETNSAKMLLDDVLKKQEKTSKFLDELRYTKQKPKRRTPEMEFAVEMIVTIENEGIGVIIGWEEQSPIQDTLSARFSWSYTVCCKNRILYYRIGQDKLTKTVISDNDPIHRIEEIGKYFCEFNGTYYMLNEMMREVYEEDVLFLINYL